MSDANNNIDALRLKFKPAARKYKNPEIVLQAKEGAKLLRKTLKKLFPDTVFSVVMSRGTAYGSISVTWLDGASYELVDVIAQHFKGNGFDGMSDSSYSLYALNEDGKVIDYGLGYVSISRGYSREFLEKLQASFSNMLQNRIKQEGVTIKGDVFNAYFDAKEHFTQGKINDAKVSHSTGKYRYGGMLDMLSANEPPYIQQEGENNVSSTSNAMESNSDTTSGFNSQQSLESGDANESGELGRLARPTVNGLNEGRGSERDSGTSISENDGAGIGERSDTDVSTRGGERGVGASDTATQRGGSNSTNDTRTPIRRERDEAVVQSVTTDTTSDQLKQAEQLAAEGEDTEWGNAESINKALPYLLPEQRDDVLKAEKRLIEDNKNGLLFTNGTGTGKTFTGLGAVKRFANAGKSNILIVSMNDKIIKDFIKSAKKLQLDIHQLDGISDNGKDKIVATTYANLAQNASLGLRDWDLIIVDEAHNLMQGEKGKDTNALAKLRALSGHHAGFNEWVKMRHADKAPKPVEGNQDGTPKYNQADIAEWDKFKEPLREKWEQAWSSQTVGRTKVIFLTATPFSYVKTLDWAEGYLFDFVPPAEKFSNKTDAKGTAYNSGNAEQNFYMSNFGYKMRYNKLTRPNSKVDVGILERKFAEKLKNEGAISGRDLSVPFDYDRKFVLVKSKIGEKIDEGFKFLREARGADNKSKYNNLSAELNKEFDYLARLQLLEAIKSQEAIIQIKKHLALGRKVIVFHDYNVGGATNPFKLKGSYDNTALAEYESFKQERPDFAELKLNISAPVHTLRSAFPNALLFNGTISKGQRAKNADLFNSDDSGYNIMIAQSDAAATGISFHDTTGKYQRVLINVGMPTKPAKLRQTEGRIYRVGQASNAIQRYLTTGTDWERIAFSQKIAERAETVDNLAQGESAVVSIKDALVRAYEEAEYFEPSVSDGIGGKAYDEENAKIAKLSPHERAKTDYWVKQKITAKRGNREGKEWYATPEPVGLMMVRLSGAHSGDEILEPSAGDGAIGRYMPSDASVTFIEPSESLASRARMNNTNANVIVAPFEQHLPNNKYDAIVMNPPFGQGGSIAIKHLVKAFDHLRNGGRVVALLPVGNMEELMVKRQKLGHFQYIHTVAMIDLPSVTFENAGTAVNTRIYVFEKHEDSQKAPNGMMIRNLAHIKDISELFDAIEDLNIKPRTLREDEALAEYGIQIYPERNKYIVTGEGVKRPEIVKMLFGSYIERNSDGDIVEKYNRGKWYLQILKREGVPTMEQLNESNRYDAVDTPDPHAIIAAIRTALSNNTPENIQAMARVAGLELKPNTDTDIFGEPINQGFDLFGDPIQDNEESPVEELPRLAVVELPLNKLTLSEDVPQFKSGADDDTGVVEALGGKFDRTGVAPIQVWERLDGRLEIISGRHRTDLARRSGEKTIPAQVHKESEGFSAKQAMMLDAELNIRDGQGKVKDYVDYFTHSEISEEEADRRGLISRAIGQRAFAIASKGSEELITLHRNEIISDQAAADIANIAPNNSAMQAVGLRVLQEHKPLNNALNTIRAVQALTREKGQEPDAFDLFGFDDSALKEAEAMARIASRKQRLIAEQLTAIKGAVKNPKLAAKHGVVVENEADALAKVKAMTAEKARWDNWSSYADLLAEVRRELNDKLDAVFDDDDDDEYYWLCHEELAA